MNAVRNGTCHVIIACLAMVAATAVMGSQHYVVARPASCIISGTYAFGLLLDLRR